MTEAGFGPGDVFAGYAIESLLGTGGMGAVFLARHPNLPRKVALKLLHRSLTGDDYVRSRFEHEANHAARLEHPNIVAVYDRGRVEDQLWISMQYVAGTDAAKLLQYGPVRPDRAVHIVAETGRALDHAHHLGILHRDVKPANILLAEGDYEGAPQRVLLTDFGIAKALDEAGHMTRTGTLVATLHYASPEQIEGHSLDGRADVYSLGCTLFHLITGVAPYPGPSSSAIMLGHLNRPVPKPSFMVKGIPQALDDVIATAMAKNREERYRTCAELAAAARKALAAPERDEPTHRIVSDPQPPRPPSWPPQQPQPPQQSWPPQQRQQPQQSWPGHQVPANVAGTGGGAAKPWWRRPIVPIAVAVALVTAGILAFALWPKDEPKKTAEPEPPASTEPNPGAEFDGMYEVTYALTGEFGKDYTGEDNFTEQWAVQTHCDEATGPCVTSVSTRDPADESKTETSQFVLDFDGEKWTGVRELVKSTCSIQATNTALEDVDTWDVHTLELTGSNRDLSGNRVRFVDEPCGNRSEFDVTLTRTGDIVPALRPPNPADIGPPGTPSPALALTGTYQATLRPSVTPPGATPVDSEDYSGQFSTYCLRTGERCASVLVTEDVPQGYFFIWVDGTWTHESTSAPQDCATPSDGRLGVVHFTTTLTAGDPGADPLESLSGTEVRDRTGDCAGRWELTQQYQRTGN